MHDVMGTGRLLAGRYRLYDPIGRGAMGIVWRGRDELLARDVAVKEVQITSHASPADAEVLYQRTLREARTAARLSHPSVVTVFDVVEENGSPWIVMELIDARSLDQVITEDGPLPPEQAADLGTSLISALATAHSAGVLHRDVKPSNVLVTKEGQAVLTDFGIATFSEDLGITQAGMVVGTPGFTAPERIRGDIATPASDLWSLGATLYAAVEGRGPFDRIGGSSVIAAGVAGEDAPRAPSAGPLGPVIDALLSRDPDTRPDATTAARLLADAATAARTGPRPLRDGWLAAEASREPDTENTGKSAAAGEMGLADSGFLDPPDYGVLQIPDSRPAADSAGSGELASRPAPAAAGLAAASMAAAAAGLAVGAAVVGSTAVGGAVAVAGSAAAGSAAAGDRLATAGQQPAAAPEVQGSNLDPGSGPALWGPVKGKGARGDRGPGQAGPASAESAGTEAAPPPVPPGPGLGGPGSTDGGRWGAAGRAWRSSGKWRLAAAASGIAAIVVAAIIGFNIFQHSGPVSALGGVAPPGSTAHPGVSGRPAAGGSGRNSSGSHSGSGGPATGSASGSHGSSQGSGNPSSQPSGPSHPSTGPGSGSPAPTPTPSGSASPTPSPTVSTPPGSTAPVLPAGYRWHKFTAAAMGSVAGFKIGMPDAWTQVVSGQAAHLNQTVRNFHLTVNLAYWLYAKPLREAQYLQGQAAAAHKHDYKVLTLAAVGFKAVGGYTSAAAAELKYSWKAATSGVDFTKQVLLVTLSTSAGSQPYAFSLWAPTATFPAAKGILHTALPTFRPMPGA
jgi:eukaryotic-like serine/threonine-protein kinase